MEIRSIAPRAALTATAIALAVIVALRLLWIAHAVFIVSFFGILLGLALSRATDRAERMHLRRGLAAPLIVVVVLAVIAGLIALLAPSIRRQSQDLSKRLPQAVQAIEKRISGTPAEQLIQASAEQQTQAPPQQQPPPEKRERPQPAPGGTEPSGRTAGGPKGGLLSVLGQELRGLTRVLFPILSSTVGAVAGLLIAIFIAIFIATSPRLYREGILHLVPHRSRTRAEEVLDALGEALRGWLMARLIAMVVIGLITGIGLAVLRVPGAAALGLIAGLLELIPFFGPILAAIPAVSIGLMQSPQTGLLVAGLYLIVQQLEGNLVTPVILKKRLDIPPVLTIVAVSLLGVALGVPGMLLAEPLLAAILVLARMLYVEDVIGDDLSHGENAS